MDEASLLSFQTMPQQPRTGADSKPAASPCALAFPETLQSDPLLLVGHGLHPLTLFLRRSLLPFSHTMSQPNTSLSPYLYDRSFIRAGSTPSPIPFNSSPLLSSPLYPYLPSLTGLIQITYFCTTGIIEKTEGHEGTELERSRRPVCQSVLLPGVCVLQELGR